MIAQLSYVGYASLLITLRCCRCRYAKRCLIIDSTALRASLSREDYATLYITLPPLTSLRR